MPELINFMDYLKRMHRYTDKEIEWHCIWVENFFRKCPDWEMDGEGALREYLRHLSSYKSDFAVMRAEQAIKAYFVFLDSAKASLNKPSEPPEPVSNPWIPYRAGVYRTLQEHIRIKHLSIRTEKAYLGWTNRFLDYLESTIKPEWSDGKPCIVANHLRSYLSYLAVKRKISAATQEQAFNALLLLFRVILHVDVDGLSSVLRAKRRRRLPVVLTRTEVGQLLSHLQVPYRLMASLMYASGIRLEECLSLRVKDLNFDEETLEVRSGKGGKDRLTLFPQVLHAPMLA